MSPSAEFKTRVSRLRSVSIKARASATAVMPGWAQGGLPVSGAWSALSGVIRRSSRPAQRYDGFELAAPGGVQVVVALAIDRGGVSQQVAEGAGDRSEDT